MTRDMKRVLYVVLNIALVSLFAVPVFAETSTPINSDLISGYGLRDLSNAIIIKALPTTPSAGETVHFTVESSIHDLQKSDITWLVNGKKVAEGLGVLSTDVKVDSAGNSLNVSVSIFDPVWGLASAEVVIVPLQLDLVYDAPTYVPPFYRGRALPSSGGVMRLQAIARFTQGGVPLSESAITYTWSQNGRVLENVSGLGRSNIVLSAPDFYDTATISVRASAVNDTLSANGSVSIPSVRPVVHIYEDHALFGITYFNALTSPIHGQPGFVIAAVPYFVTSLSLNDPLLQYAWRVNFEPTTASSTHRNEITLDAGADSDEVRLAITHLRNFFVDISGKWTVIFGSTNSGTKSAEDKSDVFHNSQP